MTDIFLPSGLPPSRMSWSIDDFTMADESAVTGATQTSELYGTRRWRCRLDFDLLSSRDGSLHAYDGFIAALRGKANRVWVPDAARRQRGVFPAPELVTNPTFANGTVGYAAGSEATLAVQDGRLRVKRVANTGGTAAYASATAGAQVQYAPYAWRAYIANIVGIANPGPSATTNTQLIGAAFDVGTAPGLRTSKLLATAAAQPTIYIDNITPGASLAGDYFDVAYASYARCALVDGGGNYMLQSDAANTTWLSSGVTVSANAHTAPDGTATADALIESSGGTFHYIYQSYARAAAVEDWCVYVDVGRTAGSRDVLLLVSDGVGQANCVFNLGTGTAGTPGSAGGVTNARAYIVSLGNGYYRCFVVGRLQSTTEIRVEVQMVSGGTNSYPGDGSSRLSVWHMGANRSSVPSRPTATTTTVVPPSSRSGSSIYLKGLPASTSGLAAVGDVVEIQGERKRVTASLDSDAAGLGYLQFEPPMRVAAADNAPVVFGDPLCRMRLAGANVGTEYSPGVFGQGSIELVEAA